MLLLLIISTNFRIMNTLQKTLIHFGLTEADTKVYLTLNQRGESDISTLVKETKLSRTAIYDSINSLTEKKLLTHRKVGKTAYYNITHPQQLENLLIEKRRAEAELEHTMQASIKELTRSYNLVSDQPGVYFFNGKEEIISMYEDFYQDNVPVDSIEEKGEMLKFINEYAHTYVKKRIQHNMYNRCIAPDVNTMNTTDPKMLREVRLVPTDKFPFRMDVKIAGSKTVLVTFNKEKAVGLLIDNKEMTNNFKILFNFLWETIDVAKIGDSRPAANKLPPVIDPS